MTEGDTRGPRTTNTTIHRHAAVWSLHSNKAKSHPEFPPTRNLSQGGAPAGLEIRQQQLRNLPSNAPEAKVRVPAGGGSLLCEEAPACESQWVPSLPSCYVLSTNVVKPEARRAA